MLKHMCTFTSQNGDSTRQQQQLMAFSPTFYDFIARLFWKSLDWTRTKSHQWMWGFHKWGYPQIIHSRLGFSFINHPFLGTPIYGNTPVDVWERSRPRNSSRPADASAEFGLRSLLYWLGGPSCPLDSGGLEAPWKIQGPRAFDCSWCGQNVV